jgi:hypothetical protein
MEPLPVKDQFVDEDKLSKIAPGSVKGGE